MTDLELIEYYADLLILQYRGQEKAYATVSALVGLAIVNQLPVLVQDAFTLGTAEGAQLDIIGKYVGVSRDGYDFTGPVTLSDDDYTTLIKMAIIQNSSGSSLYDIQYLISVFFPGTLYVFDYQDMRMSYFLDSNAVSVELAEFFIKAGSLPKPMGVQLGALIYAPILDTFFGMRTYDADPLEPWPNASPFNNYDSYQMDYPWLSYTDAIAL